jgi:SSS family solute:Na+ symporter
MILQPHASADTINRVQAMSADVYRGLWAWVVCVTVTIIVSYMTKPVPEEQLVGLVYGMTPIPHDGTTHFTQRPIFWAGVVAAVLVALNIWLW